MRERSAQPSGQQSDGLHTVDGAIVWMCGSAKKWISCVKGVCCEVVVKFEVGSNTSILRLRWEALARKWHGHAKFSKREETRDDWLQGVHGLGEHRFNQMRVDVCTISTSLLCCFYGIIKRISQSFSQICS
jgi:hypothetical protein